MPVVKDLGLPAEVEFTSFGACRINSQYVSRYKTSATRLCYLFGPYIVKVGEQGRRELRKFDRFAEQHRRFFLPILAHGKVISAGTVEYTWVAQQRLNLAQAIKRYSYDALAAFFETIRLIGNDYEVDDLDMWRDEDTGKPVLHNWTVHEGSPLCFDYGY